MPKKTLKKASQTQKNVAVEKPERKARKKRTISIESNEKIDQLAQKWLSLKQKSDQLGTEKYNMKKNYDKQTGIDHKVLGWGFIVDKKNDRLEVLFEQGIKYLISNYK